MIKINYIKGSMTTRPMQSWLVTSEGFFCVFAQVSMMTGLLSYPCVLFSQHRFVKSNLFKQVMKQMEETMHRQVKFVQG